MSEPTSVSETELTIASTSAGEIEYIDCGQAEQGDPVLFIHGSPGGSDQGEAMTAFLVAAGFRVIAPSRPGYRGTPLTDDLKAPESQVPLFIALMDFLGIDKFTLMTWSGGGPLSYSIAAAYPDRVTAVVAIAAVSKSYEWHAGIDEKIMMGKFGRFVFKELAAHTPKQLVSTMLDAEGDLTKAQRKALAEHVTADPAKQDFILALSATIAGRKEGLSNDMEQFPLITDLGLAQVSAPVLLIHGTADSDVAPEYSDYAAAELPNAELIKVDAGTHIAVWTDYTSADLQSRITSHLHS